MKTMQLMGKDLEWCSLFEGRLETLRILNLIGEALTDKGRKNQRELQKWIEDNGQKYLELTGK